MTEKIRLRSGMTPFLIFDLAKLPAFIGRDPRNEVCIEDESVSARHASLMLENGRLLLKDMGSRTGTFLNGVRIDSSRLSVGDSLRLGGVSFRVESLTDTGRETPRQIPRTRLRHFTETMSPEDIEPKADESGAYLAMSAVAPEVMLRFFTDVGRILEQAFDMDQLLDGILQLTMQVVPAERGFVLLTNPDTGALEVKAGRFLNGAHPPNRGGENLSTTILQRALAEGKAVLTTDAGIDARFRSSESVVVQHIRGAMCVPLKGRSETLGAIYVDSRLGHREFSPDALKLLLAVGVQIGIAVENVRLYDANVRAVRLAAVGQAVAGLSHCVKNILNGSESGFYLLQKGIRKGEDKLVNRGLDILSRSRTRLKELVLAADWRDQRRGRNQVCPFFFAANSSSPQSHVPMTNM